MKYKIYLLTFMIGIYLFPINVFAKEFDDNALPNSLAEIQITENQAIFSFSDINVSEKVLLGPLSETSILFSVPSNWKIASGSSIQLQFSAIISDNGRSLVEENVNYIAGTNLIVEFNGEFLGIVNLNSSGSFVQSFLIPDAALISKRQDGRHVLTVTLDARLSCTYNLNTTVTIEDTSLFNLFYSQGEPDLDLSKLPAPFYLDNSIIKDSTLVVVEDNPNADELQSAINIIAGFGSMINDEYSIQLLSASSINEKLLAENHLIFVGQPEKFSVLADVKFEQSLNNNPDDGVIKLALSPWNPSKAVLSVAGNSSEAIAKAAYAISTGDVLIYQNPKLAYVSNVQFLPSEIPVVEQFTLEDLGYTSQTLEGVGRLSEEFVFYVAKSQIVSTDAYIELIFNHSGMADYSTATFSLFLNDNVFYTKVLAEESEQVTKLQIRIPPGILRYGENVLEVRADLLATPGCKESEVLDPWFSISNQSLFVIPSSELEVSQTLLQDLKFFPEIFTITSDLSEITFVLPSANSMSWQIAANIAYELGLSSQLAISNIKIAYSDSIPEDLKKNQSMIVIGKPSEHPFVAEINQYLPAPFDIQTNIASEKQLLISYRIPDGQDVGYLELLPSPFNNEKTILFIAGNTDNGVRLASNTLLLSDLQDQLAGVFAVTNGIQIATGSQNSSFSIIAEGVPGSVQVAENPISPINLPQDIETPTWLIPFLIFTFLSILVIIFFIIKGFLEKTKLRHTQERLLDKIIQSEEDK